MLIGAVICTVNANNYTKEAFYKYERYYVSGDGSYSINAYVGGDVYNYIINGTLPCFRYGHVHMVLRHYY